MTSEQIKLLIAIIVIGILIIGGVIAIVVAFKKGEVQEYIKQCMKEAEVIYADKPKPEKSKLKLQYVIEHVEEKYKITSLFVNIKRFVETMIDFINSMGHKSN